MYSDSPKSFCSQSFLLFTACLHEAPALLVAVAVPRIPECWWRAAVRTEGSLDNFILPHHVAWPVM